MFTINISRARLPWLLAAAFAVTLSLPQPVWALANASTAKLLSSQLPSGVTLASASINQVADATHSAVSQRPDLTISITQVAIVSKTPKTGHGQLSCKDLMKIVDAAVSAAPDKLREVVELAMSLHPECSGDLDDLLRNPSQIPGAEAGGTGISVGEFGAGFGSGFPGSPGFIGSAPGGTTALPPSTINVTSTT